MAIFICFKTEKRTTRPVGMAHLKRWYYALWQCLHIVANMLGSSCIGGLYIETDPVGEIDNVVMSSP